jgi:hypothetical protein
MSVAGNALGVGVLVSTQSMSKGLEPDPEAMTAVVQPGVMLGSLDRLEIEALSGWRAMDLAEVLADRLRLQQPAGVGASPLIGRSGPRPRS